MLITKPCSCLLIVAVLVLSEHHQSNATSSSRGPDELEIQLNDDQQQRNTTTTSRRRTRRFARFPSLPPGYVLEGAPPPPFQRYASTRFGVQYPGPQTWRQQKSYWRHSDYPQSRPPGPPVMGHRTPRLIFRDNDFPVVGSSNSFFQSNQLPDADEDFRGLWMNEGFD